MIKLKEIKTRIFPKGIKREFSNSRNRIFKRTTQNKLVQGIERLNIQAGSAICVHAMLSGLGYISGGPETIIKSIKKAVPESTLIMPTFPFDGSTEDYLSENPVYNKEKTPSRSGLLSETLRKFPGSKRSYHPTHPCVSLGPEADYLIEGSELSETPFGDDSSYGRFCRLDNAVQLLIHTNSSSIVHRVQELVNIPNLFYQNKAIAKGVDKTGKIRSYEIYIHMPKIPLYWILPGDNPAQVEYIWSPDYAFLFPDYNRTRILNKLQSSRAKSILLDRHSYFLEKGIYTSTLINGAEIVAVRVKPWLERICKDLTDSINTYPDRYSIRNMTTALEQGLLVKQEPRK